MNPYKNIDMRKLFESKTLEEINEMNREQLEEADRQYKAFITSLKAGKCYLCGSSMNSFNHERFCLHWFNYPKGIRKKYFLQHLNNNELSFISVESYFRWMASTEDQIKNISDLRNEMSENSFFEATYIFNNIEWSVSVGKSDKHGHIGAKVGDKPHYHIQMLVGNRPFIRFNDLHILFTDADLFTFEFIRQNKERAKYIHSQVPGISILENEEVLEILDKVLIFSDDFENATFETTTIITSPDGKTISSDTLSEAMRIQKETGKPISQIMRELISNANITKVIYPGKGVPEITKRSGKK